MGERLPEVIYLSQDVSEEYSRERESGDGAPRLACRRHGGVYIYIYIYLHIYVCGYDVCCARSRDLTTPLITLILITLITSLITLIALPLSS